MDTKLTLEEMARRLRESGRYRVNLKAVYKRKTFAVDEELLASFTRGCELLGYGIQDAVNEAIAQWLAGKSEAIESKRANALNAANVEKQK